MNVRFYKALWGMETGVPESLDRIAEAGYTGVEAPIPETGRSEFGRQMSSRSLGYVAQGFPMDVNELEAAVAASVECGAEMLNVHSGRDWWTLEQSLDFFRGAAELADKSPIPIAHETHRGRVLFHPQITARIVREVPEALLTADVSHFTVVCESLLENQEATLREIYPNVAHVHARVGYAEGPQVPDPRAPEWQPTVARFEEMWDAMLVAAEAAGRETMRVVPEFGPPDYMHTQPFTRMPVSDLWDVCLWMRDRLADRWSDRLES